MSVLDAKPGAVAARRAGNVARVHICGCYQTAAQGQESWGAELLEGVAILRAKSVGGR